MLGLFFVGLAYIGWVLPGVPGTPFALLASYFFSRSSPRLDRWLRRLPYFGTLIRDWEQHRGMRPRVKLTAVCMVLCVITLTVISDRIPLWAKCSAVALVGVGIAVILFVVPTVRVPEPVLHADTTTDDTTT